MSKLSTFLTDTPLSWTQLTMFTDAAFAKFNEKWESARENKGLFKGDDWTSEKKTEIWNQDRHDYSIGFVAAKLNQVSATQRANRTSVKFSSETPEYEPTAEIMGAVGKDLENKNTMKYKTSDVFDSGVAVKHGVMAIRKGFDKDFNYYTKLEKLNLEDFMWDVNSTEYEHKTDCLWQCEVHRYYRYQLREMYGPKIADAQPQGNFGFWGKKFQEYYIGMDKLGRLDYDLIAVFTMHIKATREYYSLIFGGEVQGKFKSKKKASEKLRELKMNYLARGIEIDGEIIKTSEERLDKYTFTASGIIEYEETDYEYFPYSIYHALQFEDDWWSLADLLKSPQQFFDRMLSQIDYAFGTDIKNAITIYPDLLADGQTPEQALDAVTRTGGYILGKDPRTPPVQPIQKSGVNPQWLVITEMMTGIIDILAGGPQFSGRSDNKREGWQAKAIGLQAGQLFASLFTDNLQRWLLDLWKKILWFEQHYDTEERMVKVMGGALSQQLIGALKQSGIYQPSSLEDHTGYLHINDPEQPMSLLKNASLQVIIGDAPMSDTDRQQKMAELASVNQLMPGVVTPDMMIEFSDVDYSLKQKIAKNMQAIQQAQQQQRAQDQKTAEDELKIKAANAAAKLVK